MQDALVSKDQFTAQVIFWVQVEQTVPLRSRLGTCCINYWRFNFFVKSVFFRAYANFETGIPGAGPRMRRVPVEPLQWMDPHPCVCVCFFFCFVLFWGQRRQEKQAVADLKNRNVTRIVHTGKNMRCVSLFNRVHLYFLMYSWPLCFPVCVVLSAFFSRRLGRTHPWTF